MFQKMKKSKGFTLIEMLVVIAIIAVLVSIIIPVVSNSTDKAKAAANAANLRSVKAEVITCMLTGGTVDGMTITGTTVSGTPTGVKFNDLTSVASGISFEGAFDASKNFEISTTSNSDILVKYDGLTIDDWAALAG